MTKNVQSAIFDRYVEAENAVKNLRAAGVEADHISIIAREDGDIKAVDGDGDKVETNAAKDVVGKAAAGAGVGALLGVAAMAIPGVGPFVAAGAIAQAAAGGAAITGTAVGAAAGGIAGALIGNYILDVTHSKVHKLINSLGKYDVRSNEPNLQ